MNPPDIKVLRDVYLFALTSESLYIVSTAKLIRSLSETVSDKSRLCSILRNFRHLRFLSKNSDESYTLKRYQFFLQNNASCLTKYVELSSFIYHDVFDKCVLNFDATKTSEPDIQGTYL